VTIDAVTLTQMRYALALNETRSFSNAARLCHVTQSTLSIQIQKMEELLGLPIFDRNKKPLEPTAVGAQILAVFENIIEATENIPYIIDKRIDRLGGRLKLGIIPSVSPFLAPVLAQSFSGRTNQTSGALVPSDDFQLMVQDIQTSELLRMLENSEIDGAILADSPKSSWMDATLLFSEEFLVYLHPQHALLPRSNIRSEDLDPSDAWILEEGHCFGTQSMGLCSGYASETEVIRKFRYGAGSFDTLIGLVNAGGGFTLLPWLYCFRNKLLDLKNLKKFEDPVPVREVYYLHRKDSLKKAAHEYLVSVLKQALPPLMGEPKSSTGTRSIPVF
jgi:LysR family hydrogen peroxide-inducible transcriptional activator